MFTYFWDIETSTIKDSSNNLMQVTFLSNVVKMNYTNGKIVDSKFFRTIYDTIEYFKTLDNVIVWSHNLDYELTFLLRDLGNVNGTKKVGKKGEIKLGTYFEEEQNIILRQKHSPLSIILEELPNITFRDSYALFNKSVKTLGDELGLPKLEYDYKKVRLPWDTLEQLDYDYNERDNLIVAKSIWKFMLDNNYQFEEIPLTFTSFTKQKRLDFIKDKFGKNSIKKFNYDLQNQYTDFDFFELTMITYQGGLTATNYHYTNKFISDGVYSVDIKSSYPYQMVSRYFPIFTKDSTQKYVLDFADKKYKDGYFKGCFGWFTFKNIRIKNEEYLYPISSSQLIKGYVSNDKIIFNGKLQFAGEIKLPCNNIDIEVIKLCYDFDEINCELLYTTTKQRKLRYEEVSFLLDAFYKKETIKDKKNLEYMLSKVFINAMYGVKVTSPIRSSFSINNGEINCIDYYDFNDFDRENIYNNFNENQSMFSNKIDLFTDGCFITSFARKMLVEMYVNLTNMGCTVVYSDTDSIKFFLKNISENELINYLENVNKEIISENKDNDRFVKFKEENNINDENYTLITNIGMWEMETVDEQNNPKPLKLFVTYGAKKYGYIDYLDNVFTTVAGCSKKNIPIVIKNVSNRNKISIEESFKLVFRCGTQFDETCSGRTTAKTEKRPREEMELLTYENKLIHQYGGVLIEDTTYTLNVSMNDSKLLGVTRLVKPYQYVNIEGEIYFE